MYLENPLLGFLRNSLPTVQQRSSFIIFGILGRANSYHQCLSKLALPLRLPNVENLRRKFALSRNICCNTSKVILPDLVCFVGALTSACRIVAIDTFKQALIVHTYAHVQPNKSYVNDISLLIKLYDHVVHHYHFLRYQRESRNPGCVRAADEASPTYHGRKRVRTFS